MILASARDLVLHILQMLLKSRKVGIVLGPSVQDCVLGFRLLRTEFI